MTIEAVKEFLEYKYEVALDNDLPEAASAYQMTLKFIKRMERIENGDDYYGNE